MSEVEHGIATAMPRPTYGARRRVAMLSWAAFGILGWVVAVASVDLLVTPGPAERIFVDTLWWSLGAFVATTLLIDRSIHAPTAEGGIWVAFGTGVSFIALLILFAVAHATYSRLALATAFIAQTGWLLLGVRRYMRLQVLRLGVLEPEVMTMLQTSRDALNGVRLTHVDAELIGGASLDELQRLDGAVIDRYTDKSEPMRRVITQLKLRGVRIYSTEHVHELLTGRLALHHTEDSFLDDSSGRVLYAIVKRLLDLGSALILLLALCLPMALIAMAIRVLDRQPALFRQQRVGLNGEVFVINKFCTMRSAAPGTTPGATRLGRWLRRYRLDELPQLFNVLHGTMSLIGPRPEWTATASEFFDRIPHYPYRHLVRPGITGWAQVNQGHVTALPDAMIKLELDLYYVKHMSFALDLVIGVRTLRTIVTGHGAQ